MENLDFELVTENIFKMSLEGLYFIQNPIQTDARGYFTTAVNLDELEAILGYPINIRQMNRSHSAKGVLRGIHLNGWNKIITLTSGFVECVFVDARPDSPTFRQSAGRMLGSGVDYAGAFFVPKGIGNSFLTHKEAEYVYLVDKSWETRGENDDLTFNAFDPGLGIKWDMDKGEISRSNRDRFAPSFDMLFLSGKFGSYRRD